MDKRIIANERLPYVDNNEEEMGKSKRKKSEEFFHLLLLLFLSLHPSPSHRLWMIFLYVYSRGSLTFSLGSSARSSAPSLCSPRCSSRRCPARLATSCFADSGVWSRGASPCCPQRLLPPPRWRPCNHHHPPSRISSPPAMETLTDRQNTHDWISRQGKCHRSFPNRRSNTAPFIPTLAAITPPYPPFWRTLHCSTASTSIFRVFNKINRATFLAFEIPHHSRPASKMASDGRNRIGW